MFGYVEITIDKPRRLHYDANAICEVETALDKDITEIINGTGGFRTVRALLWGGLLYEDRGLTIERAGRILGDYIANGGGQEELGAAINRALVESRLFSLAKAECDSGNAKAEAAQ